MKISLLYTPKNIASLNIAQQLLEHYPFKKISEDLHNFHTNYVQFSLINTHAEEIISVPTDYEADLLIVLSTHRSKNKEKMLTVHYPGNWDENQMGGESKTLNIADGIALKNIFKEIAKRAPEICFDYSLETDHHGPTCNIPIIFVEIGPEEPEWSDKKAAKAMADAVICAFSNNACSYNKNNPVFEMCVVVGGGHYPKLINKLLVENDTFLVSHILPKYLIDKIDENIFGQAIKKNKQKLSKVIILKDETNTNQKTKIIELCKKFSIHYELL